MQVVLKICYLMHNNFFEYLFDYLNESVRRPVLSNVKVKLKLNKLKLS